MPSPRPLRRWAWLWPDAPSAQQQAAARRLPGLSGSAYDTNWIQAARGLGGPSRIDTGSGGRLADPAPDRLPALVLLVVGMVVAAGGGGLLLARKHR